VLNNLAACFGLKGDWERAFEYQSLVLSIEPHYCPFSYHFIKICGEMELFTTAIQENSRLRALYPHPHESDEEILMILLSSGKPERAQEFLDEMFCESDQERARLQDAVHKNREAKEKTQDVYEVVFDLIRTGKREAGLELIENAVKIYPQDYLLLANYAFFLRINERYDTAAGLLFWLLKRVFGSPFYTYFLANGIYCHLMGDDPQKAVPYFKSLYEAVTATNTDSSEMEPWNFPGLAVFFLRDGFVVEDSPKTAISILERAFSYVNHQQRGYLEYFCDRLRMAQSEASSGRIPQMLFQE
jgi:tetratricopeptide (TPR) repeat protein